MKWKWRWLILLCLPLLAFAVWILSIGGRQIPVDVIGDLPEKDVTEIVAAAKRELRHEILPNFSWQSLKNMPAAIRRCSSIKLITVFKHDADIANVLLWQKTNGVPRYSSKTNYANLDENASKNVEESGITYHIQLLTNADELLMVRDTNGWRYAPLWH